MKKILAFTFVLGFMLTAHAQEPVQENGTKIESDIIDFPDVEAEFKGGRDEMMKFISNNVQYPFEARKDGIQGRVYMSFVVRKSGKIADIKVERGVHEVLDEAATEVIKMMPRWRPAEKDGEKVNCRVRLPIAFMLDSSVE
ncbi:MAG: energy transducer TonB [Crocinitomicaceae bacterium]